MGSLRHYKKTSNDLLPLESLSLVDDRESVPPRTEISWKMWSLRVKFTVWHDHYRHPDNICFSVHQYSTIYQAYYQESIKDLDVGLNLLTQWYWRLHSGKSPWWVYLDFPFQWQRDETVYREFRYTEGDLKRVSRGFHVVRTDRGPVKIIFPWTN
jgi:hypothetical protein